MVHEDLSSGIEFGQQKTRSLTHDDDARASVAQRVPTGISLPDKFVASTASWTGTGAGARTVQVLRYSCSETGGGEEAASRRVGLAVGRPEGVARAVMGEGRLEGRATRRAP